MNASKSIDIRHVAKLARLHLSDEEVRFFQTQVGQILGFVETLNEVGDLKNVCPTSHPLALSDVFRKDEPKPSLLIDSFLKKSPKSRGRFFEVPKVIDSPS